MNPFSQVCLPDQRLSKSTILAMLDSKIDASKVIVVSSGEIINVQDISLSVIHNNINNRVWVYYETLLPRRIFLTNPNWEIKSFNPSTRMVCIQMFASSGTRNFNITLPQFWTKY
jgi:hypothetical protein